jgi:hypothetical protein
MRAARSSNASNAVSACLAGAWAGDLLEQGGREQEALGAFEAAVAANPNFIAAQLRLADALRRTDQLENHSPLPSR